MDCWMNRTFLTIFALFLLGSAAGAQESRIRLQYPLLETRDPTNTYKEWNTSGWGLAYAFSIGLGIGYTALSSEGHEIGESGKITLEHNYVDLFFTGGDVITGTIGYGQGVSGNLKINGRTINGVEFSGDAVFLGGGFASDLFEVFGIYRNNTVRYKISTDTSTYSLSEVFIGVGLLF